MNTPRSYIDKLKNEISLALEDPNTNRVAAFDADGTCWFSDVGRDFFTHQINTGFFPNKRRYSWDDYNKVEKEQGVGEGLLWLAQILKDFKLEEVRAFGEEFNRAVRPQYIEHQKEIIKYLIEQDVTVYVVTASVKWSVEAGLKELGIPASQVIGVETNVIDGVITDTQKGHMTWREGKVKALLEKTNGVKPFFASGNTMSDVPLLHSATHLKQIIHSTTKGHEVYESELDALKEANEHGWLVADFMNKEFK